MPNKENLQPEAPCVSATNFSFEWKCPVDRSGNPFRVGYRICKKLDCINPAHITQSRYIAKRVYGFVPDLNKKRNAIPVSDRLLLKIAKPVDRDNAPKECQVPLCDRPHRGLHLCNAHHGQLYRYRTAQGETKRFKQDNSDIEQYMLPPKGNSLKAKERYCHYPNCSRSYFARGLCKLHHKRWLRWKQENVRAS